MKKKSRRCFSNMLFGKVRYARDASVVMASSALPGKGCEGGEIDPLKSVLKEIISVNLSIRLKFCC